MYGTRSIFFHHQPLSRCPRTPCSRAVDLPQRTLAQLSRDVHRTAPGSASKSVAYVPTLPAMYARRSLGQDLCKSMSASSGGVPRAASGLAHAAHTLRPDQLSA